MKMSVKPTASHGIGILNDSDPWPVMCPECGHEIVKSIGQFKETVRIACEHCGSQRDFNKEGFAAFIQQWQQSIYHIARNSRFTD